MKKFLLFLLLAISCASIFAQVKTITLVGGIGGKDALIGHDPNSNLSGTPDFACNTWTCDGSLCIFRGLIQFDLSGIQPGDSLVSASLSFYANLNSSQGYNGQPTYGTNNAGWLRRITSPWQVDSVTWNNQPSITDADEVTLAQSDSTDQSYLNMDVTAIVNDMLTNGNYGFMLMEQNETTWYNSLIFGSSANSDSAIRPVLVLNYVPRSVSNCLTLVGGIGGKDALIGHDPNNNFSGSPDFACNTWTCDGDLCVFRGLIQFDLSSIDDNGFSISSASLSLHANLNSGQGYNGQPTYGTNNAGWLRRITSAWNVDSVTWNNQPSITETDQVSLAQSDSTDESYLDIDVTSLVKDMVANGNYGFMLMEQNETTWYNSLIFGSSANADSTIRPTLQVCYTAAAGVQAVASPQPVIKIYPNPATSQVNIQTNQMLLNSNYYLYDLTGRLLLNGKLVNETTTLDIQSLDAGVYIIRVGEQSFKMVKE